jgi:hypothetical protein
LSDGQSCRVKECWARSRVAVETSIRRDNLTSASWFFSAARGQPYQPSSPDNVPPGGVA